MNEPLDEVNLSRSTEVAIAVLFAIGGLRLFFLRGTEVRLSQRLVGASIGAMAALFGRLRVSVSTEQTLAERRDLQYELLSERRASQSVAYYAPEYAARRWPHHLDIQRTGYDLLDACTTTGRGEVPATRPEERADAVRTLSTGPRQPAAGTGGSVLLTGGLHARTVIHRPVTEQTVRVDDTDAVAILADAPQPLQHHGTAEPVDIGDPAHVDHHPVRLQLTTGDGGQEVLCPGESETALQPDDGTQPALPDAAHRRSPGRHRGHQVQSHVLRHPPEDL